MAEASPIDPALPASPGRPGTVDSFTSRGFIPPTRAFLVTALSILLGEALSVVFGGTLVPRVGWPHELMDTLVILALTLPSLYFFFARPMSRAIRERTETDGALQRMCADLDQQVLERTRRLVDLNQALCQSEEQYSSVVANSPTGIFILKDGRVVFANKRFLDLCGFSLEDVLASDPTGLIHPEDVPRLSRVLQACRPGDAAAADCDFRILNAASQVRWISGRFTAIRSRGMPAILGNIQDITEAHEAENRLKESRASLQMLSARALAVQEEERRRVARDLHDDIGQSLTAIKFMIEKAMKGLADDPRGDPLEELERIIPVIQHTIEETRRICMALRPSILDDLGLVATLTWFTREYQKAYPAIDTGLLVEIEESEIPEALKTTIFRVVQEAMNNVAKHARASGASVTLRPGRGCLCLAIQDNGVGFAVDGRRSPDRPGGFGLVSMRERTEALDGSLVIASTEGAGTTVTARWPLATPRDLCQD